MPQLRQLVIAAENPERLAKFYQEVFDLEKIEENRGALFLSDGIFNLGLVPEPDPKKRGFRHLGFATARVESMSKKLAHVGMADSDVCEVNSVATSTICLRIPTATPSDFHGGHSMSPMPRGQCRFDTSPCTLPTRRRWRISTARFST